MDPELELSDFCSSVLPLTHFFFSLKRWGKFNQLLPLLSSFISKKPIFKDPTGLANLEGKKTLHNRYSPKRLSRKPVCLVTQSCLTLCNLMDCSLPDSSVHGFSRQEYWSGLPCPPAGHLPKPRGWTQVSRISGRFFTTWAIREAHSLHRNQFSGSQD